MFLKNNTPKLKKPQGNIKVLYEVEFLNLFHYLEMAKFDDVWDFLPHISFYQIIILSAMSSMAILGGLWTEIWETNFQKIIPQKIWAFSPSFSRFCGRFLAFISRMFAVRRIWIPMIVISRIQKWQKYFHQKGSKITN